MFKDKKNRASKNEYCLELCLKLFFGSFLGEHRKPIYIQNLRDVF